MENFEMILSYLNEYNEAELFYKKYYELQEEPEKLDQFVRDYGMERIKENKLIVPHLLIIPLGDSRSLDHIAIPENYMFDEKMSTRDAYLSKHNRYSPVYIHTHDYFEMFYVMRGQCHQRINEEALPCVPHRRG